MNLKIIEARHEDCEAVAKVNIESWKSTYHNIVAADILAQLSVEESAEGWKERITDSNCKILISKFDQHVCGFSALRPYASEANTGEVWALYLLKEHQRLGIGSKLWNAGIKWLSEQGYQEIIVWVLEANTAAQEFYKKMGCLDDGGRTNFKVGLQELPMLRFRLKK